MPCALRPPPRRPLGDRCRLGRELGRDEGAELLADQLLGLVAEHFLGRLVGKGDLARAVGDEDQVGRRLDQDPVEVPNVCEPLQRHFLHSLLLAAGTSLYLASRA